MPNLQADLAAHCIRLEQENEKLKSQVAMLREALIALDESNYDAGFQAAEDALYATASSDAWLNEQKDLVRKECADQCEQRAASLGAGGSASAGARQCASDIKSRMAAELRGPAEATTR